MKEEILENLGNPKELEKLYRANKSSFKNEFSKVYSAIAQEPIAQVWHERLNFETEKSNWNDILKVIVASILAGCIAKIPEFFSIKEDYFYARNIGFIVLPFLIAFFVWKHKTKKQNIVSMALLLLVSLLYINILPNNEKSNTLVLACIHLPLFLWSILGFSFMGNEPRNLSKRLEFLRYNGDMLVISALILITGGLLSGITIGLFNIINYDIVEFYTKYIVVGGLAATPLVGTYILQTNPQLVNRVTPIIAKVFTPLVLIMLGVYLVAIITSGKDPYTNRDFLLMFNVLLVGVLALILFSVAETSKQASTTYTKYVLLALSCLTIIVNSIALSAILFRISTWGFTPNRLAVLGSNILILANLLQVAYNLFKSKQNLENVESSIAYFLPFYSLWAFVVVFLFPMIFGFR